MTMEDWVSLVDFDYKTQKFDNEKSKPIAELPIFNVPGGKSKVTTVKRLHHLSEFRFFSLGSAYIHCNIPFDVIGEFRATMETAGTPYDGPRVVLKFNNLLFTGMKEWGSVLEGLNVGPAGFDRFKEFMTTQRVRQKDSSNYWTFKYYEVVIPDPMAVDNKEYSTSDPDTSAVVGLFLPSGNRYQVGYSASTLPPLTTFNTSPDQVVVNEATAVLNV